MANQEIKNLIKKQRLFRYEIADAMGISEGYLSTLLRKPLTEEMEQRVKEAINKLIEKGYSKRDAIKEVSDRYNVSKNKLYNEYKED